MFKRILAYFLSITIILNLIMVGIIPVVYAVSSWSLSGDNTGWIAAYPANNQNDYLQDQQTGSGSVSQDIVGNASYPSTYIHFTSTEVAFRIRISNNDGGTDNSNYQFKNFAFVGLDADYNGSVDFFLGAYNPTGNKGRLGIYSADSSCANTSPSTTGISGKPLSALKPVRDVNYSIIQTADGSNFNGDADYYVSFKFSLADIASALSGTSYTFNSSTPFRFMTGTAAQDNSFNQDLNGMDSTGWSSGSTWNTLGVFSAAVTAADGFNSTYRTVVFDKNTGDNDPNPAFKVVASGSTIGTLPSNLTKKGGFYFQGWNTQPDGSGTTVTTSTVITNSMTVYAQWSNAASYNVTFNPNGGDWSGSTTSITVSTINGVVGGNLPPDPTRTGYVFNGWTLVANNNTNTFDSSSTVTGNITVYAYWVTEASSKIPVNFYNSDGTILIASIYPNGNSNNYNSNTPIPSRAGYTFSGWCATANGSTIDKAAGDKIGNNPTVFAYYAVWQVAVTSYTLTFNANGGTLTDVASRTVTNGFFGTMPTAPTRSGYVFVEWNRNSGGTGEAMYPTSVISANTTVYAIWKAVQTVTFNANGGQFDSTEATQTVNISNGALLTLPQPPSRDNFTFIGWSTSNSSSTANVNLYSTAFTTNQILYAVWSPVYNVTFNPNSGSWTGDSTPQVIGTAYGSVLYMPDTPSRTGYTFKEWNTSSLGNGSKLTMTTDISGNTTVYAIWTANTYNISYTLNGGTNPVSAPGSYTYDTATTLPLPTRSGYAFDGWFQDSNLLGSPVTSISDTDTGNKTVYAKWTAYDYTITYNLNEGTNPDNAPVGYVTGRETILPTPTKPGFVFDGWYTASDFSGSPVTSISDTDTGNKTFYAKWTATALFNIIYNLNGGTNDADNTATYTLGVGLTLANPTRAGYTFGGWYTASDFSGSAVTSISAMDTGDKTFYATWTANIYNITYNLNAGTNNASNAATYTYGIGLTLADPTRTSYTFGGWYTSSDFSGSAVTSISATDTDHKTFYAKWTADTSTVTLNANGGSGGTSSVTATNGQAMPTATAPSRTGYTFNGYFDNQTGGTKYYAADMSSAKNWDKTASNVTLYAQWTANDSYNVTGSVIDDATPANAVQNATVVLMKGNTQYGNTATSAADGSFTIYNVPAGEYNLVITRGEKIVTVKVIVSTNSTSFGSVVLPLGNASSQLSVRGADTPAVVVDNLHPEAEGQYTNWGNPAGFLKVVMTVEKTDKGTATGDTATGVSLIDTQANSGSQTVGIYLDITVDEYKRNTELDPWGNQTNIRQTSNLVQIIIPIPAALQGKSDYTVYRYHQGALNLLTTAPNSDGEYIVLNTTNWTLTLYVKNFSVYAIAYTTPAVPGGSGTEETTYQITQNPVTHGGLTLSATSAPTGTTVTVTPSPDTGYILSSLSIRDKNGNTISYTVGSGSTYRFTMPSSGVTVTASFSKKPYDPVSTGVASLLETNGHIRYLGGYPDNSVRPENNMTRAEAAQMFYNLLLRKNMPNIAAFKDVKAGDWYSVAVNTLASMGIIGGYPDGRFGPDDRITREQFVTMAVRFVKNQPANFTVSFSDVSERNWSYKSVLAGAEMGWMNGYSDGTFKPAGFITRAEVATIVNNMLGRSAEKGWIDTHAAKLRQFTDLTDSSKWYYYTMREATNAHDYKKNSDGSETWTDIK